MIQGGGGGGGEEVVGDLLDLATNGEFDVIVHGCNCFQTMGAGIARLIKKRWPAAYRADLATEKGSFDKLGTFTYAVVHTTGGKRGDHKLIVVNAYTQYHFSVCIPGTHRCVDYDALRVVFRRIKKVFTGNRIGYPMIGAGLAGGDWDTISGIIQTELDGENHTFVKFGEAKAPTLKKQQGANETALQEAEAKKEQKEEVSEAALEEEKVQAEQKTAADVAADPASDKRE